MDGQLPGGHVTQVSRVGDTVRRAQGARAEFVHSLLKHLEDNRWDGAPRFLGIDAQGREILSYIEGRVAWGTEPVPGADDEDSLIAVARMVRQFHDLTEGSSLAGGAEVVCHNDLSPKNTVYRDEGEGHRPVAFIDWDIAAPGERIHDVAHMCWQYVGLGPRRSDVAEAGRLMRSVCDAYGLDHRGAVVQSVLWWQDRCWRGIEAQAEAGVEAMVRLRDGGASRDVRAAYEWVATNREALEDALA